MKKLYGRTLYDTEASDVIRKYTHGFFGDPAGYEEILYRTQAGNYFVYGNGGEESAYPQETLIRLPKAKVEGWISEHE